MKAKGMKDFKFKAGLQGFDPIREYAENMVKGKGPDIKYKGNGDEMDRLMKKSVEMKSNPISKSAPIRTPMRPYSKGGKAGAGIEKVDMSNRVMKKGGYCKKAEGGPMDKRYSFSGGLGSDGQNMKKGGKIKHKAMGGWMGDLGSLIGQLSGNNKISSAGRMLTDSGLKKGGVAKPKMKKMIGGQIGPRAADLAGRAGALFKKGGQKKCYAIGGVGKIRHKEATMNGAPLKRKK